MTHDTLERVNIRSETTVSMYHVHYTSTRPRTTKQQQRAETPVELFFAISNFRPTSQSGQNFTKTTSQCSDFGLNCCCNIHRSLQDVRLVVVSSDSNFLTRIHKTVITNSMFPHRHLVHSSLMFWFCFGIFRRCQFIVPRGF